MVYSSKNLNLVGQGIARVRNWDFLDSGGTAVATLVGAGWFEDAGDKGAEVGDRILVRNISATNDGPIQYEGRFTVIQDTGATQGTIVLDTG